MLEGFANPPAGFRLAPFWFLNHRLRDDELIWQIDQMQQQGFGGFILHSRYGRLTPYLSGEWMERLRTCCEEAKRRGMWAWLYDEDNWPSGTVGGLLPAEHPEWRMSQLYLAAQETASGKVDWLVPGSDELYCVLAVPWEGLSFEGCLEGFLDLTDRVKNGRLACKMPKGKWKLLAYRRVFGGYVDTLNREVIDEFIRRTHEPYAEALGGYFGGALKGVFTDEPSGYYSSVHESLPFTPSMPAQFEERWGYPFAHALVAAYFDVGPATPKLRCDYMETFTSLYVDAFYRPIYDFCEERGLISMGHVNSEGEYLSQIKQHGDFFRPTELMHYSGVDTLFDTTWPRPGFTNNLTACKFASSAGHLLGKPRVMAEAFGVAAGWKLTLRDIKLLGEWQVVLGVNYLMPHAAYYSVEGFRKWECPPDEFYHNPYWPYYGKLAERFARLCALFTGGRHAAPVAVLSPVRSAWAAIDPGAPDWAWASPEQRGDTLKERIEAVLNDVSEGLLRHRYDYDYITEEICRAASVREGELCVTDEAGALREAFGVLVLPHVTVLSRESLPILERFAGNGGLLVFVGATPYASPEVGLDEEVSAWAARLLGERSAGAVLVDDAAELVDLLAERGKPDADVPGNTDIVALHHEREGRDLYLLLNTSRENSYERVQVSLAGSGVPHLLDPDTGEVRLIPDFWANEGRVRLTLDFPVEGSRVVMLAPTEESKVAASSVEVDEDEAVELDGEWAFALASDNYLRLPRWELDAGCGAQPSGWLFARAAYEATVRVKVLPARAVLIGDGLHRWRPDGRPVPRFEVYVNDERVTDFAQGAHYDRHALEADVTSLLREGDNALRLVSSSGCDDPAGLTGPLLLAGPFAVGHDGQGEFIAALPEAAEYGSWTQHGFPYLSGAADYTRAIEVTPEAADLSWVLRLGDVRELAEVFVNGRSAGAALWPPYEVPVVLRAGRNEIRIRVVNTLHNAFVGEARPSGLFGPVRLCPVKGS